MKIFFNFKSPQRLKVNLSKDNICLPKQQSLLQILLFFILLWLAFEKQIVFEIYNAMIR